MGACCSKTSSSTNPSPPELKFKPNLEEPEKKNTSVPVALAVKVTEQEAPKKEVFIVKHRKSQETDRHPDQVTRKSTDRKEKVSISTPNTDISQSGASGVSIAESGKVVGATVRTSSCTKEEVEAILIQCGRLSRSSSGVKPAGGETPTRGRRYSGSKRSFDFDMESDLKNDDDDTMTRRKQQPENRVSSPSSRRRRSRERDPQQQRSGSKERGSGSGSGGRRVSRSPNRRSESPNPNSNCTSGTNRPGKMVSVPATDKSNSAGGGEAVAAAGAGVGGGGVKRIQVKRNAGDAVSGAVGTRTVASPRARSPRKTLRVLNENQNLQPVTLSRSNSRKAEQSPYRRNPLGEIDTNAGSEQPGSKINKNNNAKNCVAKEAQMVDEIKPAVENPKHNQIVSKTRSLRLSRDLDINPEALLGPNPNPNPNPNPTSYASLLLEDIQNFHQKNPTTLAATAAAPPAFSLPACVSKACSIMEAVADLNSTTGSNQFRKENVMESEKVVNDDLMEPSLHKYVTVKRGGDADNEEHEIESSGSNSFAGSQQLSGWVSSSWEPNSGDSNSCWSSNGRDEVQLEYPRNGIGRGRLGVHGRSAYSLPNNVTVAST